MLVLLLLAGCAGEGYYTGSATVRGPELVSVSPGVEVIADYDEPVFYTDNYYWRYNNGNWYRSNYYNSGWVYASPPRALVRIDRPYAYRHYRPHGYVARRPVRVRDHRDYRDRRDYRR